MPDRASYGNRKVIARFSGCLGLLKLLPYLVYPLRDKPDYHVLKMPARGIRDGGWGFCPRVWAQPMRGKNQSNFTRESYLTEFMK
jgi:hypothetical protein